jgi:hypothetical protein
MIGSSAPNSARNVWQTSYPDRRARGTSRITAAGVAERASARA